MGEMMASGLFADTWRVRRDGRLVFAENVKLSDDGFGAMQDAAMAGGAHVALTLLFVARDAEDALLRVRTELADAPFDCATSAWDGKLVVRGLAHRSQDVRHLMHKIVPALGGVSLPRVWSN